MSDVAEMVDAGAAAEVAALLCGGLGENYTTTADVAELVVSPDAAVFTAREDGALIAAATVYVLEDSALAALGAHPGVRCVAVGERVAVAKASTVVPAGRGCGFGSRLAAARIEWARGAGCDAIVALSWRSGGDSSFGLWVRSGLEHVADLPDYWRDLHGEVNPCPMCGPMCGCTAALLCTRFATP